MSEANEFSPLEDWVFFYLTHEMRTPLNALLGFSQMMRDGAYGPLTEKQQDRLERMVYNAGLVLRRLDLLLDYNRVLQEQLHMKTEYTTLQAVLQEALAGAGYDNRGRNLQVAPPEEALETPLAVSYLWAAVAVREVLLHAASEARPDPTIWLTATSDEVEGMLRLRVRYHAPPMDHWAQGNLFTVHNRTGIGLPLALELLSRMHGGIEYDSHTTQHDITVRLPLAPA